MDSQIQVLCPPMHCAFPSGKPSCARLGRGRTLSSSSSGTESRIGLPAGEFLPRICMIRRVHDALLYESRYAPYQALVKSTNTLVYVPIDNSSYIRAWGSAPEDD